MLNPDVPIEELKDAFSLSAAEVFYRRSLPAAAVRGLYRSTTEAHVIVVHAEPATRGEALNCGVNLARYRYLVAVDHRAAYNRDVLDSERVVRLRDRYLRILDAAVADPDCPLAELAEEGSVLLSVGEVR